MENTLQAVDTTTRQQPGGEEHARIDHKSPSSLHVADMGGASRKSIEGEKRQTGASHQKNTKKRAHARTNLNFAAPSPLRATCITSSDYPRASEDESVLYSWMGFILSLRLSGSSFLFACCSPRHACLLLARILRRNFCTTRHPICPKRDTQRNPTAHGGGRKRA